MPLVVNSSVEIKPLLRWAGSKRKLIPRIESYWRTSSERYIEPFAGSASLFYSIRPNYAVLGDINIDLIQCLKTVKRSPNDVYDALIKFPKGERNYYKMRATSPKKLSTIDRAARFLYLNRFCFNGLYRTNGSGEFNVPYASSKTSRIPTRDSFLLSAGLLKNTAIECDDFEALVRRHALPGDFVYFDPPYAVASRRIFNGYDSKVFTQDDIDRLAQLLCDLDREGVFWVLSYAYSREALAAFGKWPTKKVFAQRNIAGFSKHRRKAAEVIISNIT